MATPPHPPPPAWLNPRYERRCARCDHDLSNLIWAGTCPTCGLGYREAPDLDDDGFLRDPLPCQRCDYDLRGLRPDRQCPECGLAITRSFGALLCESDESWVKTLQTGAGLLVAGLVLPLGGLAFLVLALLIALVALGLGGSTGGFYSASLILLFTTGVGLLLCLLGAWVIATPDPEGLGEPHYGRVRRLLRYGVAGLALSAVLFLLLWPFTNHFGWVATIQRATPLIALLLAVLAFLALLIYISRLAERIPDWDLSHAARDLWHTSLVILAVATALIVALIEAQPFRQVAAMDWILLFSVFFAAAAIALLIATLKLFHRFEHHLARQCPNPAALSRDP